MKKLFSVLTSFVVACLALLPCFVEASTKISRAQSNGAYCIVLPESFDEDYFSSNIDSTNAAISSYVPYSFNKQTDKAIEFNNKVTATFVPLTDNELTNQSDVSLFIYLYFPNYSTTSTLNIKLFSADANSDDRADNEIRWKITEGNQFYEEEQDLLVPGWREIELPVRSATPYKDGVETDPIYLKDLNKLTVSYSITEEQIGVFGAYLAESSSWGKGIDSSDDNKNAILINTNSLEQYSHITTSALYYDFVVGKLKGDKIQLPEAEQIFVGAKIGGQELTLPTGNLDAGLYYKTISGKAKTESLIPYKLEMRVSSPNGQVKYYALGETTSDNYSQSGKYYLQLVLLGEVSEDRWEEFASAASLEVNIGDNINAIWFDTTIKNITAGYTYKYYFTVNSGYWRTSVSDISISASNDNVLKIENVVYQNNGKGYVEVKALKGGSSEIVLEAKLTRLDGKDKKTETTSVSLSVTSDNKESNKTLTIIMICVLAVGVAGGLAYAIYEIVKHNKMQIK